MKEKQRLIIDTDPGIDDALAILLALAEDSIQLEGLSIVHGNCSTPQGTANALSILELAGAEDIPVYSGFERPLVRDPLFAPETHGNTGLGYASLPLAKTAPRTEHAVDFIIKKILSAPGEITLVAVGPLTNVAAAIRLEPGIINAVKQVIVMGGAIQHSGNTTPLAEFNVYADPHAAHMVFHAGMPLRLVPLDVTYQCILTGQDVDQLQTIHSPISEFIADATRFYMEFHDSYQGVKGCVINDPLALALVFQENLCEYQALYVDVDLSMGVSTGNTFADFYNMKDKPPNMEVALKVRARDFITLYLKKIQQMIER